MKELNINQFQITDVGGEKNLEVELADAVNMYIEGGNIHSVEITDETDMPLQEAPSVEIRGSSTGFMKYDSDWLMRWLDKDSIRRVYPVGYNLGIVALSEDAGIYTPTASVGHAMSMIKRASWLVPVGKGNLTEVAASGSRKWMGLAVSNDETKIVSAEYDGYIYISINSGATWSQKGVSRKWIALKGGDNGTTFSCIAAIEGGAIYLSGDSGDTWTEATGAGTNNWRDVAISDDGVYCYAITTDGKLFTSANSGSTWSQNSAAQGQYGYAVTQSVEGAIIYVAQQAGNILVSRDKGKTFATLYSSTESWKCIKCSDSGQYIYAGASSGIIYYSDDFGETFSQNVQSTAILAITCSASGDIVYACLSAGIYKSTNYAVAFTLSHSSVKTWTEICCSDNGGVVAATENTGSAGNIHRTSDSGANWVTETGTSADFRSICCSSDGAKMAATIYGGLILGSTNSGDTWSTLYNSTKNWNSIACIKDFSTIVANVIGGGIFISTDSGANWAQLGIKTKSWNKITISDNEQITSVEVDTWVYDTSSNIRNNVIIPESSSICCNGSGDIVFATSIRKGLYRFTSYGQVGGAIQTLSECNMVSCDTTGNYISVIAGQKAYTSTNMGDSLTDIGVDGTWWACTVSRDGTKYAVSQEGGYVYVNNGTGWNFDYNTPVGTYYPKYATSSLYAVANGRPSFEQRTSDSRAWKTVAASEDGSIIWAAEESGYVYFSDDSGATFTVKTNSGNRAWRSICCSSDGTVVYAAAAGGQVYKSINEGSSWSVPTGCPNASWNSVACADDGIKFVASNSFGYLWISDDGSTVTEYTTVTKGNYTADISGDGNIIYAAKNGGGIIVGKYSGAWTFTVKVRAWSKIVGSTTLSSTSKVFAIESTGYLWESSDGGVSWIAQTALGIRTWTHIHSIWNPSGAMICVAVSTDGAYRNISGIWTRIAEGNFVDCNTTSMGSTFTTATKSYLFDMSGNLIIGMNTDTDFESGYYKATMTACYQGYINNPTAQYPNAFKAYMVMMTSDKGMMFNQGNIFPYKGNIGMYLGVWSWPTPTKPIFQHFLMEYPFISYYEKSVYTVTYSGIIKKIYEFDSNIISISNSEGSGYVAVCTELGYLYYSIDKGVTFIKFDKEIDPTGLSFTGVYAQEYGDNTPSVIACTSDGAIWRWVHGAWSVKYYGQAANYTDISCSRSGERIVAITKEGDIIYSDNQGVDWETESVAGENELTSVSVSNDGKSFSIGSTTGIWSAPWGVSPGFTATDNSVTDIINVNGSEISAFYKGRINSSLSSFIKYSGYFYTGGNVPDTSKIFHKPFLNQTSDTEFTAKITIPEGSYYCYESQDFEYINDITSTEYQDHVGVFADRVANKLVKAYVAYGAPFIEDMFDIHLLTTVYSVCNDLVWYSEFCEQFGARLAMANVAEIDVTGGGVDRATNGSFTAGTTGWAGVWSLVTSGGRTGANRALLNPGGYLRQTITEPETKLIFYAIGDVSGIRGLYSIEADPTNAGWYRCVMDGYTSGVIEIAYQGTETVHIDDIFALSTNLYPSSVYMSQIGDYNDFTGTGAGISKFPANSEAITGIKATGLQLFVIKEDAIGTISETGDTNNAFAVNEGQYALGGRYPKRLGDYFCILKEENGKAMVLMFTGGGFVHLNDQWDAPYSYLNAATPTFNMSKIYTSLFGNKYIIWQDSGTVKWGCIIDGTNKVGTIQMDRMVSGEFKSSRCSYPPYANELSTDLVAGQFPSIAANGDIVLYCEWMGNLWMSNDGGVTRTEVRDHSSWVDCDIKGLYAVAINSNGMSYSSDAGETWTDVSITTYPHKVAIDENGVIAICCYTGAYFTEDFGTTWELITNVSSTDITISEDIYTLTDTDIFKTTIVDGTTIVLNTPLKNGYAICSSPTEVLASDPTGVYTSIDSGATWVLENDGSYNSISVSSGGVRAFSPAEGVVVMSNDKLNFVNIFSRDTWLCIAVATNIIACTGVCAVNPDRVAADSIVATFYKYKTSGDGAYIFGFVQGGVTLYKVETSTGKIVDTYTHETFYDTLYSVDCNYDGSVAVFSDSKQVSFIRPYSAGTYWKKVSTTTMGTSGYLVAGVSLALEDPTDPLYKWAFVLLVKYSTSQSKLVITDHGNVYTYTIATWNALANCVASRNTALTNHAYVSALGNHLYYITGVLGTFTVTDRMITGATDDYLFCSNSGFVGISYSGATYLSTDYGVTWSTIAGIIRGSSWTDDDYAIGYSIYYDGTKVFDKYVGTILGYNSDMTVMYALKDGYICKYTISGTNGYIHRSEATMNEENESTVPRITTSILCGDANKLKKFLKIRVFNEKEQNFSLVFLDPIMDTVQGNNSYGVNFAARRLVMQISPEEPGATINQISLTYDIQSDDIKRGG